MNCCYYDILLLFFVAIVCNILVVVVVGFYMLLYTPYLKTSCGQPPCGAYRHHAEKQAKGTESIHFPKTCSLSCAAQAKAHVLVCVCVELFLDVVCVCVCACVFWNITKNLYPFPFRFFCVVGWRCLKRTLTQYVVATNKQSHKARTRRCCCLCFFVFLNFFVCKKKKLFFFKFVAFYFLPALEWFCRLSFAFYY